MSSENLIDELQKYLLSEKRVAYFNSNKGELTVRCPYCGDSVKNSNHGHMYISVEAPFSFYCQRCETKGYLNFDTLREFQVEMPELNMSITKAAKKAIRNTTKTNDDVSGLFSGKRILQRPELDLDDKYTARKVRYLERRFGTDLSLDDLDRLKVITRPSQFIDMNYLNNMDRFYDKDNYHRGLRLWLERYSVGFLSTDTNYITYRHLKDAPNGRRYYTESNNRPVDIGSRIYTIGNDLDLMSPELNLVLAEGVMDIGAIWLNMYGRRTEPNTVFGAVNGRAYKQFINTFRRMGFFKINLDIYSDKEIELRNYKYHLNPLHFSKIRVHYNQFEGEKDFGVPLDRVKDKVYRIK